MPTVVPFAAPRHAEGVALLDAAWVAEGVSPWRGAALTARAAAATAARDSVVFVVLEDGEDGSVAGFAWADVVPDTRDIPLDGRASRLLAELHFIYCGAAHRGGGNGLALFRAVEGRCAALGATHLELVADNSANTGALLRFYAEQCGMGYMFTRLRKELALPPPLLRAQPLPSAALPCCCCRAAVALAGIGVGLALGFVLARRR